MTACAGVEGGLQPAARSLEGSFEACAARRHLRMRAEGGTGGTTRALRVAPDRNQPRPAFAGPSSDPRPHPEVTAKWASKEGSAARRHLRMRAEGGLA
ncbi:hypothetical protein MOTC310_26640 [Methylobacterium oryzae]|uniref:Uncharacterized protein n=1 Tax=Methylobacterium oryzae TaxID=334852 RepID=A0ABU7TVF4_9HYPH